MATTAEERGDVEVLSRGQCVYSPKERLKEVSTDYLWTFDCRAEDTAVFVISPAIEIACGGHVSRWEVALDMSKGDDIGLYLRLTEEYSDKNMTELFIQWHFYLGEWGEISLDSDPPCQFDSDHWSWGWEGAIQRDKLFKDFVKNDKLVINGSITVFHSHAKDYQRAQQLLLMFSKKQLGDFTIRCQEKDIRVFKELLVENSPVLARMLDTDMKEGKEGVLTIDDIDFETIEAMVDYLYVGDLTSAMHLDTKLFVAADKYQIGHLKQLCSDRLVSEMCLGDAFELLLLGDLHDAAKLKETAMNLITSDRKSSMKANAWQDFLTSNSHLVNEVIEAMEVVKRKKLLERGKMTQQEAN